MCFLSTGDSNLPLDLCFVLDSSGSMRDDWSTMLFFVVDVVKVIHVGPEGTHIAVVTFGDDAELIFDFNKFNKTTGYEMAITNQIASLPRPGSGQRTFINRGLRLANRRVFREEFGKRPNAKQVLFVTLSLSVCLPSSNFSLSRPLPCPCIYVSIYIFSRHYYLLQMGGRLDYLSSNQALKWFPKQ